ncbi:Cysteine-rich secretory protein family protein [uncultured archaeon]|nr:Cysteine-rich secretory protein family protein [uncultured archaeon]
MINDKNEVALAVLSSPGDMNSQVVGGDSRVTFSNPETQKTPVAQNTNQVQNPANNFNPFEEQTHAGINSARGRDLQWNDKIAGLARAHSEDMSRYGVMNIGHWGSNSRFSQMGGSGAENVAAFGTYDQLTPKQVGATFTKEWMGSSGHKENILGPYSQTGIGIYVKDFGNGYKEYYATQLFRFLLIFK